ncbi:maleylacetoacetate isomerase [Actibacterium lipolyticum]|uniref:Maleylpyruvate isomerase n=1 Tax=Actibacterium lipolyticum TaxID=1524263 RepID=A0A238L8M2_9RHOB|nr:maleylacetoacetate isomerase [Actibacterium lipolyticum]SMX51170.1 Maleylpyruvate isomerase [Actibacterium lipolyticum]
MIRLFDYWRSTASYRVRIALGLAGLEWETVSVDLIEGDHITDAHLARNPQGLVPVLEIDNQRFTQSLAIVEYLNDSRALGLLPDDLGERAKVRALAHSIAMDIHPVCNLRVAKHAVENSGGGITMQSWMQTFITSGLRAHEAMLAEGEFSHQSGLSLADICLVPQLYNARRWNIDLSDMPKALRIENHLATLPAFAAAHPDATLRTRP